jgi:hypothetical protein
MNASVQYALESASAGVPRLAEQELNELLINERVPIELSILF